MHIIAYSVCRSFFSVVENDAKDFGRGDFRFLSYGFYYGSLRKNRFFSRICYIKVVGEFPTTLAVLQFSNKNHIYLKCRKCFDSVPNFSRNFHRIRQ